MGAGGLEFVQQDSCRVEFPEVPTQERINKTRLRPKAPVLGQFHRHMNRGVIGNARKPENLVQPQVEQVPEGRFLSAPAGLSVDQPIQSCLPSDNTVHKLLGEPPVHRRKVCSRKNLVQ